MDNKTTPKYQINYSEDLHISISKGNIKVGNIPQFNTLPGDEALKLSSGQVLTNVKGTCAGCCSDCKHSCYAVKCCMYHHNSIIPAWAKNTVIMRSDPEKVRREINEFCAKNAVKYFRYHTSGEIESQEQLKLYCDICKDNDDVIFYVYTKRFDLLNEYFVKKGNSLPENFIINLSEWHGNLKPYLESSDAGTKEFFSKLNIFAFDDKSEKAEFAAGLVHCPAIDKTGHETGVTCAQCKRCMKAGHRTSVYEH